MNLTLRPLFGKSRRVEIEEQRDLRLSQLFRWSISSSWTWLFVIGREVRDNSEDRILFTFGAKQSKKKAGLVDLNMKSLRTFKNSGTPLPLSQHHIQENLNLRLVKCPQGATHVVSTLCYCPTFHIRPFKKNTEDSSIWHVSFHVLHSTKFIFSPSVSNRFCLVCIVVILYAFVVLCVYCCFYFRCRTAG